MLVRIGSRLIVALPDRAVDLGGVDPEAQIIVLREQGPAGPIYDFKVGDICCALHRRPPGSGRWKVERG